MARGIRFDRNEWAGSFGDIGTDLPLVFGMVLAAGLDAASVFVVFGLLQIATGLVYRLPMPMQPLKAMAVLVITGGVAAEVLYGAGIAIGAVMLVLTATGALGWLARHGSRSRSCAASSSGSASRSLRWRSAVRRRRRERAATCSPPSPSSPSSCCGATGGSRPGWSSSASASPTRWPSSSTRRARRRRRPGAAAGAPAEPGRDRHRLRRPRPAAAAAVAVELGDRHRAHVADLFPERRVSVRKIGLTYAAVNLTAPLAGGIPACHGCGGLAGPLRARAPAPAARW
jgi:hypothetical protein